MSIFDGNMPYTNLHELNLDWVIQKIKEMGNKIDNFISVNSLKFADPLQWDITKSYEPNTIVVNDTGTAYVSIKEIPTGKILTDTEYWLPVFNITDYVDSVVNKPRKIIMIGDSYGVQNDGSVTEFYWQYFRDSLGLVQNNTFFSSFESGAGFGNNRFLGQLQTLSASISDKNSITDIFVCGGWNDSDKSQSYGTDEAFNNGVNNFNNYIKSVYPKARMTLAHISWGWVQYYPTVLAQMPVSIQRYQQQSIKGWRILTGTEWILHQYNHAIWQGDYAHPSQTGQGYLGLYLTSAFLTGATGIYYEPKQHTLVANGSGITLNGTVANCVEERMSNGIVTISMNANDIYLDLSSQNFKGNGSQAYDIIGTDLYFASGLEKNTSINAIGMYWNQNSGIWGICNMNISLYNSYFRIRFYIQGEGYNDQTIKYLWIPPFTMQLNAFDC